MIFPSSSTPINIFPPILLANATTSTANFLPKFSLNSKVCPSPCFASIFSSSVVIITTFPIVQIPSAQFILILLIDIITFIYKYFITF